MEGCIELLSLVSDHAAHTDTHRHTHTLNYAKPTVHDHTHLTDQTGVFISYSRQLVSIEQSVIKHEWSHDTHWVVT